MGVHVPEQNKDGSGDVDSGKPSSSTSSLQGSLIRKRNMKSSIYKVIVIVPEQTLIGKIQVQTNKT